MKIINRYDATRVLYEDDAATMRETAEAAVRARADLRGADLRGANLGGANLGGAYLGGAYLGGANLGSADLGGADLGGAYLGGAYLRGANLRSADLGGADLGGATITWQSHDIIAELLRQAAGSDSHDHATCQRRAFAGLVLMSPDWCWDVWTRLAATYPDVGEWARGVLAGYVRDGDGAPAVLTGGGA